MNGEKGGHDCAGPNRAGGPENQQKQQQDICDMEGQVYEMMGAAVQVEKLTIEHMRNPRNWMPVGFSSVQISKGPGEPFWGQTLLDNSIGGDVIGVVISDESKPVDHQKGGCAEH